ESTHRLLDEYRNQDFHKCLDLQDSESTAIAFITPLLKEINNLNICITEIYIDATYKTTRSHYELYSIIADVDGAGYPITYLIIDTTKAKDTDPSTGKRRIILEKFLVALKSHNINPQFVFTDKNFVEISAASNIWGSSVVQLCVWHMKQAIKRKLKKKAKSSDDSKLLTVNYNFYQAASEYDFIDPTFYLTEEDHAQGNTIEPEAIKKSAIEEIYKFCDEHKLR
ncbi:11632_t:CDS:2, partial [Scutellospora calospora]